MGEINKANQTIKNQKATATPTVTVGTPTMTTTTATPTTATQSTTTATAATPATATPPGRTVPKLSDFWATQHGGNVDKIMKEANIDFVSSVKSVNPNRFIGTDVNPTEDTLGTSVNLTTSTNNVLDKLNEAGVAPENAQAVIRSIFNDPKQREGVLGKKSLFNDPAYKSGFQNKKYRGGTTYDDDAVEKLAALYAKVKGQYDATNNIPRGQAISPSQYATEADVKTAIDAFKMGDKIKVKKTP
jgi:hypothetical protein